MSFKMNDVSPLGVATEFYMAYTMAFTYSEGLEKQTKYEHRVLQCATCESTELVKCSHPTCKSFACENCFTRCESHGGGAYCEDHLVWTDLIWDANGPVGTDPVCFQCMKEIECDEAEAA